MEALASAAPSAAGHQPEQNAAALGRAIAAFEVRFLPGSLLGDASPPFSRKKPARLQLDLQQKRPKNTLKVCHSSVFAVH
jgi:hypothetical protein